ncbi:unnamed protein product, partial [Prorocentrum cordatum]
CGRGALRQRAAEQRLDHGLRGRLEGRGDAVQDPLNLRGRVDGPDHLGPAKVVIMSSQSERQEQITLAPGSMACTFCSKKALARPPVLYKACTSGSLSTAVSSSRSL